LAACVSHYVASPGRLAFFLEGGYHLGALQASVAATLSSVLGSPYEGERPTSGGPGTEHVEKVKVQRLAALDSWTRLSEGEVSL